MNIKELFNKYENIILYLFFGGCTTLVNIFCYWIMAHLFATSTMFSTIVAWSVAVLFAYVTNRKWVFKSNAKTVNEIYKEVFSFFVCRLATGIVDWGCMWLFVDLIGLNDIMIKTVANILVIVLNYIASKLVIFKKDKVSSNVNVINAEFFISLMIIIIFAGMFFMDGVNSIQHNLICYDEGYNATVAANVMRYGQYRVSYPSNTVFYNMITTGETVILPTALLYKLFGINGITSAIIPLIYGTLSIVGIWWIFFISFFNRKGSYLISAIFTILLILSDNLFGYISTRLIGESAALFFLLVSCIFLFYYFKNRKPFLIFFSGVMVAFSFITKDSMIFFVFTFMGIMLIEAFLTRNIKKKHLVCYISGFIVGFVCLESYKLMQLNGIDNYLSWWKLEWYNIINQSSGIDTVYSISEKVNFLESIFVGQNKYFCLILILLPVVLYSIYVLSKIVKKDLKLLEKSLTMLIAGVGGSSLLSYFLILGGGGLVYARRHEVNQLFIRIFAIYFISTIGFKIVDLIKEKNVYNKKDMLLSISATVVICIGINSTFGWNSVKNNSVSYTHKEVKDAYNLKLMNQFLSNISGIEKDAVIYCAGWWQEPNITLYLDRKITNIYDVVDNGAKLADDSYFIVGNYIDRVNKTDIENSLHAKLVQVNDVKVDYKLYSIGFDRRDFDLFAIYKIEPINHS